MTELLPIEDLSPKYRKLIRLAMKVRKRAYAPYSKYSVGCVIVDRRGKIHTGCNVESDSFLASVCAERVAIFKMITRGVRECRKIFVVTEFDEPAFPCGVCRQVIHEFGKNVTVFAINRRGTIYREASLEEIFPFSYSIEAR